MGVKGQSGFDAALVDDDICPQCLGELDTGWECVECGFDARPAVAAVEQSRE